MPQKVIPKSVSVNNIDETTLHLTGVIRQHDYRSTALRRALVALFSFLRGGLANQVLSRLIV